MAISVPVPMAMPRSAAASAGASLMPSPSMPTTPAATAEPGDCFCLAFRRDAAAGLVDPGLAAGLGGNRFRSPGQQHGTDAHPVRGRDRGRPLGAQRVGDREQAEQPAAVGHVDGRLAEPFPRAPEITRCADSIPCSASRRSLPMRISRPATVPTTPRPVWLRKSLTGRRGSARWSAAARMARARGCSLACWTAAASWNSSASVPRRVSVADQRGLAGGEGPRLVEDHASCVWARSREATSLIRMPARAAAPVPAMMAVGVARPSAQGQAITSTDTAATSAVSQSAARARPSRAR